MVTEFQPFPHKVFKKRNEYENLYGLKVTYELSPPSKENIHPIKSIIYLGT